MKGSCLPRHPLLLRFPLRRRSHPHPSFRPHALPRSSAAAPGSPVKPIPQQAAGGQNLDDLLNPFAVLGLENKKPAGVASPRVTSGSYSASATGAGWTSPAPQPQYAVANPYAQTQALPQAQAQQPQWGSPHSAFQPPADESRTCW